MCMLGQIICHFNRGASPSLPRKCSARLNWHVGSPRDCLTRGLVTLQASFANLLEAHHKEERRKGVPEHRHAALQWVKRNETSRRIYGIACENCGEIAKWAKEYNEAEENRRREACRGSARSITIECKKCKKALVNFTPIENLKLPDDIKREVHETSAKMREEVIRNDELSCFPVYISYLHGATDARPRKVVISYVNYAAYILPGTQIYLVFVIDVLGSLKVIHLVQILNQMVYKSVTLGII